MKLRVYLLLLVIVCILSSCRGSYAGMDLHQPIDLPEDGIIEANLFSQIQKENAIAVFVGESGGLSYEWTVFGSDLTDVHDVNLSVALEKTDEGIAVTFSDEEVFGFPLLLSIDIDEKWTAGGAVVYADGTAVASASVTGSKTTVLNLPVNANLGTCLITPDVRTAGVTNTDRLTSDGSAIDQDRYQTDPVPEGKPMPVEPENQQIDREKSYTCTFSIECSTILNNLPDLDPDKLELVPSSGVILPPTEVAFYEGESVFEVLQRVCLENNIHIEFSWTPIYNSAYIEGIHNLYEFDCGPLSGWMYRVDGWYPNYGCSRYQLADGETVEWRYTCDLGKDVGCDWMQ